MKKLKIKKITPEIMETPEVEGTQGDIEIKNTVIVNLIIEIEKDMIAIRLTNKKENKNYEKK